MSSHMYQKLIGLCISLLLFGMTLLCVDRLEADNFVRFNGSSTARVAVDGEDRRGDSQAVATDQYSLATEESVPVGLVDYCVGMSYANLTKLVAQNRRTYAGKWNYKIFSGNEEVFPVQTFISPLAWLKAAYFHHLLTSVEAQDIEWFLWVDCDALITRFDLSVVDILKDLNVQTHHDVVVAKDPHTEFNSGVMFVRNSKWSRDLWGRTLQKASNESIREHMWWEQQALLELYRENHYNEVSHFLITPDRWKINAFRTPRRNDYNSSSFAWHRVNCREQPQCNQLFEAFFCTTIPNKVNIEELIDCGNVKMSLLDTF